MELSQAMLCHTIFDKFHQLIRDDKNGINKTKIYQEILLQSTYFMSLNYKPFHSCEWHNTKQELLNDFIQQPVSLIIIIQVGVGGSRIDIRPPDQL